MFKSIEEWLRPIIADEVSKARTSINNDLIQLSSTIATNVQSSLHRLKAEVTQLFADIQVTVDGAFKSLNVQKPDTKL